MANDILYPVELNDEPVCPEKVVHAVVEFFEKDENAAAAWLNRPNRALNWQTPFDAAARNNAGEKQVLRLLEHMEHGIFD